MHILSFIEAFDPAPSGGGPVTALRNLIQYGPQEWSHVVFTRNTDYGSRKPLPVEADTWVGDPASTENLADQESGVLAPKAEAALQRRSAIFYASPHNLSGKILAAVETVQPDIVYLHGAYAPLTRLILQLRSKKPELKRIPIVITPHGNLSPAILHHHALRKKSWLIYAKVRRLYTGIRWHAASEREAGQIRMVFGEDAEMVVCGHVLHSGTRVPRRSTCAKTGPECTRKINSKVGSTSPTTLITPCRISPEKNLLWGLKLLQSMDIPIHWRIVGPGMDSKEGQRIKGSAREFLSFSPTATDNRENDKNHGLTPLLTLEFMPPVSSAELSSLYKSSDALFLPSLSENYSFVIPEAWSHGLPTLISDQTPWKNLQEKGLGWELPLDEPERWRGAVQALSTQTSDRILIQKYAEELRSEMQERIRDVFHL